MTADANTMSFRLLWSSMHKCIRYLYYSIDIYD
jgi:hypothetical protein